MTWNVIYQTLSSLLEQTASPLPAGAWGSLTIGNQFNTDPSGSTDGLMSYSPRLDWDPVFKTLNYYGGNHGAAGTYQRLWLNRYYDTNNLWTPAPTPIAVTGGSSAQVTHGFYASCTNTTNGHIYYVLPYIDQTVIHRYRPETGTFDTPFPNLSAADVDHNSCAALAHHPNLYGGSGGLIFGNANGVLTLNLSNPAAWTRILDRLNQVDAMSDGGFGLAIYCRKDNNVYMGGGNNTNYGGEVPLLKIAASAGAGTTSPIAASPASLSSSNDADTNGMLCDSGNSSNGMLVFTHGGAAWEYDAAGNVFNSLGTVLPAGVINAYNRWTAFGAVPDYRCVVVITGTNDFKSSTTMYVWRR